MVSVDAFQNGSTIVDSSSTATAEHIITHAFNATSDNFTSDKNVTSVITTIAYDDTFAEITSGNATPIYLPSTPVENYGTAQRILSNLEYAMSQNGVSPSDPSATTDVDREGKIAMVTDIQFHFIIVGALFVIVIILSIINLYIHFRSGGGSRGLIDMKMVGSGRNSGVRRGVYSVKMAAKPSVFI